MQINSIGSMPKINFGKADFVKYSDESNKYTSTCISAIHDGLKSGTTEIGMYVEGGYDHSTGRYNSRYFTKIVEGTQQETRKKIYGNDVPDGSTVCLEVCG